MKNTSLTIGDLRHLVTVMTATSTQDSFGQESKTWNTQTTAWAAIEPSSGREYWTQSQQNADVTHKITMRYITPKPTPVQQIWYADPVQEVTRVFEIISVLDFQERNIRLDIGAKELISP